MKKFTITNSDNTKMTVNLVRYFSFKNDSFLIYNIGEVDEKGYLKLYLVRIMEELGFPVVQTIRNEADWSNMQGIVKKVLKELKKNNKKQTIDLNYKDIEGIKIVEPRFFKLDPKLADILASNYMEDESQNNGSIMPNEQIDTMQDRDSQIDDSQTMDNNGLEPIEETMINQGEFVPLEERGNDSAEEINLANKVNDETKQESVLVDNVSTNEELQPVAPLPEVDEVQNVGPIIPPITQNIEPIPPVAPLPQVDSTVSLEPFVKDESDEINPINSINFEQNVVTNENNNSINLDNNVSETNKVNVEVDYEQLYKTVLKDNEAANKLIDDLTIKLIKYKKKYGELED